MELPELSPWVVFALYGLMGLVTAGVYGIDKHRAVRGARRVRERTLHTLEFLGGWPGALVAQQVFRHKRAKPSFYLVTWLIAALHVAAWVLAVWK